MDMAPTGECTSESERLDSIGHDAMNAGNESPGARKQARLAASAWKRSYVCKTGSARRSKSRTIYLSREAERLRM